jgi:hypothetical protein
MGEGNYFEFNVSASSTVRVTIGNSTLTDTGEETWKDVVFDQFGTQFTQKVTVNWTSGYVEIKNELATPAHISGNILLKKTSVLYQAVYPYSSSGTLSLLVGSALLVYGVMTSPKKRHSEKKPEKAATHALKLCNISCLLGFFCLAVSVFLRVGESA